jgi:hypothetical protein
MWWMSRCRMLRSLGRCYLGWVDLLMAAQMLLVSLSYPLPLLRTHPPSLLVCWFLVFKQGDGSKQFSIRTGWEVNLFLSEKRGAWKEPLVKVLWYNPGFSRIGNLKILHSQPFAATDIHADKVSVSPCFHMPKHTDDFPFWRSAVGWSWQMLICFYWFISVLHCHK